MVVIAKTLDGLRKTLKKLRLLRRRGKGSDQTFEHRNPISEAEIEGESNAVEEPQEEVTAPRENSASSLENMSSASEPSELAMAAAGVLSSSLSRDSLSSVPIDHDVSNPNLIRMEASPSAISAAPNGVLKEAPNPWTPPVIDDVVTTKMIRSAIGESYFCCKLSFKFHHPLFDSKPYLGEPLKLKDDPSSVQDRLASMEDFDQRVSREKVLLELCVHGHNHLLSGFIRVANITYHKNVFLRVSYDGWSSYDNIKANHYFSYTECSTDQFSFEIPLRRSFNMLDFVIGYETDGCGTFWDNNGGKCYTVVMEKEAAPNSAAVRGSLNKLLHEFDVSNHSAAEECAVDSDEEPLLHH